jgi:hypothetical protein
MPARQIQYYTAIANRKSAYNKGCSLHEEFVTGAPGKIGPVPWLHLADLFFF